LHAGDETAYEPHDRIAHGARRPPRRDSARGPVTTR
jgi:hypothetical protein